ncbi:MAG: PspC domain-containing protein [Bacteroidales bacterium]|nr:PspC domain-containing protein [Bacteroidales bacterium]
MNKVEKVSIGKCAFSLDEKAYATIKEYLDSLNLYYSKMDSGKEILEGIEERMAELLLEKTGNGINVVSSDVANEVIEILGRPEVIEEDSAAGDGPKYNNEGKKRLYRDPSNKILGGVCSGLAAYFNTDTVLIRVLFIVLTLIPGFLTWGHGSSIAPILYIIAWIAMPKADTLRKQCEMRGQSLNIADIEQQYKDGSAFVKDNNSDFWRVFGRIIAIFVGIILLMMGISGLVAGGLAAFGTTAFFHLDSQLFMNAIQEIFETFGSSYYSFNAGITTVTRILLIVFGSLVYFLPCIGLIYAGIHLIFNFRSPSWRPGLVVFIIWLLSIVAFFVMLIIAASSVAIFKSTVTAFIPSLF